MSQVARSGRRSGRGNGSDATLNSDPRQPSTPTPPTSTKFPFMRTARHEPAVSAQRKDLKRQHSSTSSPSQSGGALSRWLRELRPGKTVVPPNPATTQPLQTPHQTIAPIIRNKSGVYSSEGKGLRKRKDRDRRRHSFNEQQPSGNLNNQSTGAHGAGSGIRQKVAAVIIAPAVDRTPDSDRPGRRTMMPGQTASSPASRPPPPPPPTSPPSTSPSTNIYSYLPGSPASHLECLESQESIATKPLVTQAELEQVLPPCANVSLDGRDSDIYQSDISCSTDLDVLGLRPHHLQQGSYAHSEGYHSYVSSSDSTSTAFLDRFRRDGDGRLGRCAQPSWDDSSDRYSSDRFGSDRFGSGSVSGGGGGSSASSGTGRSARDSVATTSSGSASSSETLKWHGSLSDVSVASSALGLVSHRAQQHQLIAHSARVQTPQRHHSESVLYLSASCEKDRERESEREREARNNERNQRRLFPVSTYTVQPTIEGEDGTPPRAHPLSPLSPSCQQLSVAERICVLERHQRGQNMSGSRMGDPALKAIQKKALLDFYERHHHQVPPRNPTNPPGPALSWRSEPQLSSRLSAAQAPPPPQPPPRPVATPVAQGASRRASSASDYSSNAWREGPGKLSSEVREKHHVPRHQHSSSCGSLSTELVGPLIVGPSICVDDWVPERPPKKPHLRAAFSQMSQQPTPSPPAPSSGANTAPVSSTPPMWPPIPPLPTCESVLSYNCPSPDLPPPSPPPTNESEVFLSDEPLPPPPPELRGSPPPSPPSQCPPSLCPPSLCPPPISRHPNSPDNPHNRLWRKQEPNNHLHDDSRYQAEPRRSRQRNPKHRNPPENPFQRHAAAVERQSLCFRKPRPASFTRTESDREGTGDNCRIFNGAGERVTVRNHGPNERFPLSPGDKTLVVNGDQKWKKEAHRVDNPVLDGFLPAVAQLRRVGDVPPPLGPRPTSPPRLAKSESTSKASYLALRRDRDRERESVLPNFEGSYKQTVPSGYQRVPPVSTVPPEREGERDRVPGRPVARQASAVVTSATTAPDRHFARQVSVGERTQVQQPPVLSRHVSAGQLTSDRTFLGSKPGNTGFRPLSHESPHQVPAGQVPGFGVDDLKSKSLETLPERPPNPLTPCSSTSSSVTLTSEASSGTLSSSSGVHSTTSLSSGISSGALPLATSSPSSVPIVSPPWTAPPSPAPSSPVGTSSAPSSLPIDLSNGDIRIPEQKPVICSSLSSDSALTSTAFTTSTSDAASQTDEGSADAYVEPSFETRSPMALPAPPPPTPPPPTPPPPTPPPTQEELEVERLSRDLARRLPAGGRLHGLLAPDPESKKPADYVPSLFNLDVTPRRTVNSSTSPIPISTTLTSSAINTSSTNTSTSVSTSTSVNLSNLSINSSLGHSRENLLVSAAYFATSEPKARLLTRYSNDNSVGGAAEAFSSAELQQKKEELVARLTQKLEVLKAEQLALTEEKTLNDQLGEAVSTRVASAARPHQATKFRVHVDEVGHITALLLGLSGRLARAENALLGLPQDHVDRESLEMKRDKLRAQLAEAKQLKANIDQRSLSVSGLLGSCLSPNEFADYQHFINMKAKLIVDSRELADKISLGEEQLSALKETLLCSSG